MAAVKSSKDLLPSKTNINWQKYLKKIQVFGICAEGMQQMKKDLF